jgi:TolB-like protein
MEPETEQTAPAPGLPGGLHPKERPGWTAIVLVLSFVLFGVALYVAGALMVKRPAAGVISIAVLPFVNADGDSQTQQSSDRLTEELLRALGHVEGLRVAPMASVLQFKGRQVGADEVGRKLGVGAFIQGNVRKSATHLRVEARLVSTVNRYQLWSQAFTGEKTDDGAAEREIARGIADAVVSQLRADLNRKLMRK